MESFATQAIGNCHCGAVTLMVPHVPNWAVQCGCTICKKLGTLWAYYLDDAVKVSGETATYVCNAKVIGFHRCIVCGCTTHWKTLGRDFGKMAINARLLEDLDLTKTQIRVIDGPTPAVFGDVWPPRA